MLRAQYQSSRILELLCAEESTRTNMDSRVLNDVSRHNLGAINKFMYRAGGPQRTQHGRSQPAPPYTRPATQNLKPQPQHTLDHIRPSMLDCDKNYTGSIEINKVFTSDAWLPKHTIPGGSTNIAYNIGQEDPSKKIGILIAGNNGRPGGKCGNIDSRGNGYIEPKDIHAYHKTQEEDVVSNWIITEFSNTQDIQWERSNKEHTKWCSKLYDQTIGNDTHRWGMKYPNMCDPGDKRTFYTKQKYNYRTKSSTEKYGNAWHLSDCVVSQKKARFLVQKYFEVSESVKCSLVFVAGPNAKQQTLRYQQPNHENYVATCARTYDQHANENYEYFKECVKHTLAAGLTAMAKNGDKIAVLCHVSGGLYAGPHKEYTHEILRELTINVLYTYKYNDKYLINYFERVVYAPYTDPTSCSSD